ncbi:Uncharacterised protein [Mycobacteroides abscessus subsp. abscessus]|nr:Uncharacterised protein [Mycobacteroides abscessus subsp. abscessus]
MTQSQPADRQGQVQGAGSRLLVALVEVVRRGRKVLVHVHHALQRHHGRVGRLPDVAVKLVALLNAVIQVGNQDSGDQRQQWRDDALDESGQFGVACRKADNRRDDGCDNRRSDDRPMNQCGLRGKLI